jgi:hypothetical protein
MSSDSLFCRKGWIALLACGLMGCGTANTPEAMGTDEVGGQGGVDQNGAGGTTAQGGAGGVAGTSAQGGDRGSVVDAGVSTDALSTPPLDAGTSGGGDAGAVDLTLFKPALVGYGYGALRIFSFDGGKTWPYKLLPYPGGGDDENLIRGMAYNEGTWLAAGWKIFISRDGAKTWSEIAEKNVPGGWYDCVNFKNGKWIVKTIRSDRGGQSGGVISSSDNGLTWKNDSNSITCNPVQPNPAPAKQPPANGVVGLTQGMAIPPGP